jgi:hypothetical protein
MPVVSVTESQEVDPAGQLTDVYEIVFTVPNQSGTFTIQVDKHGTDPVQAARDAIARETQQVNDIYSI